MLQTISYGYTDSNWKDKLTSYDGMDISYDAIGNITGYNDMMFVWGAGRRLSACMADSMILFGYNSQGERIRKFAAGVATLYTMHGKLLTHLTRGSDSMHFYYDANSRPAMVDYNGEHFTYLHNLQGDVVGLVDSANSIVVEYKYDAWGKLLSTTGSLASTLGYLNPFRYRGYIYDEETGLYYLHSRYYDPRIGRFLSADVVQSSYSSILHSNLYCYCLNNPIIFEDYEGNSAIFAFGIGALLTMIAEAVVTAVVYTACAVLTVAVAVEVTNVITDAVQTRINEQAQQETTIQTQIQTKAQEDSQSERKKYHLHHIVAQKAWRAAPAQKVLARYGIDVNYYLNLVLVPVEMHARLHTNIYYNMINIRIVAAGFKGREAVINELEILNELITRASVLYF